MAQSQSELLASGKFVTDCEGVDVVLPLPEWMGREYTREALDEQVARHGVEAVLNLFYAQAIIDLRARVRFAKRTQRTTKDGVEKLTPLTDAQITERLEKVVFNAPRDGEAGKVNAAKKLLSGLTPGQIAALLKGLGVTPGAQDAHTEHTEHTDTE